MSTSERIAYQRYGPALVRKAERILLSRDDAVDVVHGLFTDLLGKRERHSQRHPMTLPFLYRAVTNRSLNLLRDRATRARILRGAAPELRGPVRQAADERVFDLDVLTQLVDRLDRGCLDVLISRYWDDMAQEDIAQHLGTSRKTVGKRLRKIHDEVRRIVDGAGRTA